MITYYSDKHRLRQPKTELEGGQLIAPFECPERVEWVLKRIHETQLGEVREPRQFGPDPVLRVHDAAYVDFLATCWEDWRAAGKKGEIIPSIWPSRSMNSPHMPKDIDGRVGYYALAGETSICAGTWEAAQASKDVALSAMQAILEGEKSAFALCRPPGHHAARDQYGGYCFLNNAAIAAQYARDNGHERVVVLDIDFHHGNGTQDIFYERDDVLVVSIHGDPSDAFPHFLGYADEVGKGTGQGYNLNISLPQGTPYSIWATELDKALAQIQAFNPQSLIVSLGVDTFAGDPISFFKLASEDFIDCGQRIAVLGIDTLFVMEGGYAVEEIGINAVNVLQGFNDFHAS